MGDTHEVRVVRVGPILPHPNADKLQLTMVGGFQIVIAKDQFKEGDLAVYIQPDSVVPMTEPFRFIWGQYEVPSAVPGVPSEATIPARRRRITVKRLRKEYSEGLLMPVSEFGELHFDPNVDVELQNIADQIGVTRYVPEGDVEDTEAEESAIPKRKYPRTVRGWFFYILHRLGVKSARKQYAIEIGIPAPTYDVNAYKNATRVTFREGELVTVTEKIHGSNARFVFILDNEKTGEGRFFVGSHYQWKAQGDGIFWKAADQHPYVQEWCVQHPGQILYAEVGPTQKGFNYGCEQGETFLFSFDVYHSRKDADDEWYWPGNVGVEDTAPILYSGPFSKDIIEKFVDGPSVVPKAKHLREGIVIHSRERRLKLKVVSNKFYEGDSK